MLARYFLLIALSGCSTVSQKLEPGVFYKRDMDLAVNGSSGVGVVVVPNRSIYEMDIRSKGKLDLFTLTTCHREDSREKAGEDGLFGDKKRVKLIYAPVVGIETGELACPVQLGGYSVSGKHSWGFVDFESPELTVDATVKCNGSTYKTHGVSVCQSKAGLLQEIIFADVMDTVKGSCGKLESDDGKAYRYTMPKGQCAWMFMDKGGEIHRHTTIGYESILVREL